MGYGAVFFFFSFPGAPRQGQRRLSSLCGAAVQRSIALSAAGSGCGPGARARPGLRAWPRVRAPGRRQSRPATDFVRAQSGDSPATKGGGLVAQPGAAAAQLWPMPTRLPAIWSDPGAFCNLLRARPRPPAQRTGTNRTFVSTSKAFPRKKKKKILNISLGSSSRAFLFAPFFFFLFYLLWA